jgi:hypothetical protein
MFAKLALTFVGVSAGLSVAAFGQPSTSGPVTQPAATQPVASRPAGGQPAASRPADTQQAAPADPRVHAVLQLLEKKGDAIKDLTAGIEWRTVDAVINSTDIKTGTLYFKRDKPHDKFLVRFDKTIADDQEINKPEEHCFDGEWYVEKREATKTIIKRQIVRPGEQYDPFKLGEGPFPLPFGQKESEILDKFDVTYVAPAGGDPENTVHLKLIPKATSGDIQDKYAEMHFYIDKKIDLPVKVVAKQKDDKTVTVLFKDLKVNTGIPGSRFVLQLPKDDPTWEEHVESLTPEDPGEPSD